jgi:ABC-type multidrug transport system fused ATPase/permease subunit
MRALMTGRTSFVIAHRPSTLATCDAQLVIERGRLATSPPASVPDAPLRVLSDA